MYLTIATRKTISKLSFTLFQNVLTNLVDEKEQLQDGRAAFVSDVTFHARTPEADRSVKDKISIVLSKKKILMRSGQTTSYLQTITTMKKPDAINVKMKKADKSISTL